MLRINFFNPMKHFLWGAIILAGTLCSCQKADQWSIKGDIGQGDTCQLVLEATQNGRWYGLDTAQVVDGKFEFSHAPSGFPDIYRLRLNDKYVYFPIDSLENLTFTTTRADFGLRGRLTGSTEAEAINKVDSLVLLNPADLKDQLSQILITDPAGIVAYYIISKNSIFDPADPKDLRIIGAVANGFTQQRPNDPRTTYLKNLFLTNKGLTLPNAQLNPSAQRAPEINLYDWKGESHSLLDETSKGRPVVLNFTDYSHQESPEFNRGLNALVQAYDIDVFQVALDEDEINWKATARNLPWTAVLLPPTDASKLTLQEYNVTEIPTIFLFDTEGDLVNRFTSLKELEAALKAQ